MKGKSAVVVGVIVVILGGALWFLKSRKGDSAATPKVTQASGVPKSQQPAAKAAQASGRVSVTVKDQAGPIPDAYVRIAPEDGEVIALKTGKDGVAIAEKLAAGSYAISASATGHEPAAAEAKQLADGEDAKLTIELKGGGRLLSGVVTDVSGGAIAGARIDAAKIGAMARPDRAVATTITGPDGKYQLAAAEGQLLVAARSADYAPQSRIVDVGPTGATADFALVPGGVIEGVVLDERTRQPIQHAIVNARRDSAAILLAETGGSIAVAGADGKFRLSGLKPGAYELGATGEGRRSKAPTIVGLGIAEQATDVEILVGKSAVVRGTVIDESGAPVKAARVMAMGPGGGEDTSADEKGAFALEGLQPGKFMLFATSAEHVAEAPTQIELKDKDLDNVIVRLKRGAKVIGRVEPPQVCDVKIDPSEDGDSFKLPAARVMNMSASMTTSGPDGKFELGPTEDGKQTIEARCASGDQGKVSADVKAGMGEVVVAVKPGGSIAGRVVDTQGKPVGGVSVSASAQDGGERTMIVNGMITSGVNALTSSNGEYVVRGLAPGAYRASVLDRGRPMAGKDKKVTLAAGEKKTGVDLVVERPNGVIKGVVQGPDGKPLADAWVSVHQDLEAMVENMVDRDRDEPGERRTMMMRVESDSDAGGLGGASDFPPALTDAQGRFEIRNLPKAKYEVLGEAQAGKLRGRQTGVTPDAEITLRAAGVTSLSGTVKSATGPTKLFTVELDGPTRAQRTFTDGKFELGRVDPGNYVVKVMSDEGNAEVKVTVSPGQPANVDISLVANAIVTGTLVDEKGKPVAGVPVAVVDDQGDGRMRIQIEGPPPTSGPDGKFRVEHKAGVGILVVMTPPSPVTQRGLKLEAGKTLDVGPVRVGAP